MIAGQVSKPLLSVRSEMSAELRGEDKAATSDSELNEPLLVPVESNDSEDTPSRLFVRPLQPKTTAERLILMPSMDKQRKFQEPLGLLRLSLNCPSALSSIQRETYRAESFSALSSSEHQKEKLGAICQPKEKVQKRALVFYKVITSEKEIREHALFQYGILQLHMDLMLQA
ncbi:hypothetical protein CB1_000803024 [Camelus ferus]|nr:hypothetical protein CB1_000803024 [Camelus ferus]